MPRPSTTLRDPLHGTIPLSQAERAVLDHPLFQRLRNVRQLGFSDLSFPGATHNRYLHSIGAMHLAGKAWDRVVQEGPGQSLAPGEVDRLRSLVRTAALLHDSGHAPFSHASEFAMPTRGALEVPVYEAHPARFAVGRQATHEDYTVKIVTDSSLTSRVAVAADLPAQAVACLIDPDIPYDPVWTTAAGVDWRPLLQQLISSELDVDRMDYLARDSHFAGVHYGVFDVRWLLDNLCAHVVGGQAFLAIDNRAIYAFDDFLIARYHMFLMVYYHYRSVAYEQMLQRYFEDGGDGYALPTDIEAYAGVDDYQLLAHLRRSGNPWAQRIVQRREYKLLLERHGDSEQVDLAPALLRLKEAGIPAIAATSKGVLSKYFVRRRAVAAGQGELPLQGEDTTSDAAPIFVLSLPYRGASARRAAPLEYATALFERYSRQLLMQRIYVPPEQVAAAGQAVDGVV